MCILSLPPLNPGHTQHTKYKCLNHLYHQKYTYLIQTQQQISDPSTGIYFLCSDGRLCTGSLIYISHHFVIIDTSVDHHTWTKCIQFTRIQSGHTHAHTCSEIARVRDTHETHVALNLWVPCTVPTL